MWELCTSAVPNPIETRLFCQQLGHKHSRQGDMRLQSSFRAARRLSLHRQTGTNELTPHLPRNQNKWRERTNLLVEWHPCNPLQCASNAPLAPPSLRSPMSVTVQTNRTTPTCASCCLYCHTISPTGMLSSYYQR